MGMKAYHWAHYWAQIHIVNNEGLLAVLCCKVGGRQRQLNASIATCCTLDDRVLECVQLHCLHRALHADASMMLLLTTLTKLSRQTYMQPTLLTFANLLYCTLSLGRGTNHSAVSMSYLCPAGSKLCSHCSCIRTEIKSSCL